MKTSHIACGVFLVCLALSGHQVEAQPELVLTLNGAGGSFTEPWGPALDDSGNVYIPDLYNRRIVKFDANGNFITMWGSYGSAHGQFNGGPFDVAVDAGGNVYTVEVNDNYRVQKFDSNGKFITTWGSYGSGPGHFINPLSLAVDRSGYVYVADGRVQKFDGNGYFITWWTVDGGTRGIDVDVNGNVYVTDQQGGVVKFDGNGELLRRWQTLYTPYGIATDANGKVYVAETNAGFGPGAATIFTGTGALVLRWGERLFDDPRGIAVDPTGSYIYVADIGRHQVLKFRNTPLVVQVGTWSIVKGIYR